MRPGVDLATLLRSARERAGLKKAELARRVGVSHAAVSQWEKGETAPSRRHANAVALALGLDPSAVNPFAEAGLTPIDISRSGADIPLIDWGELSHLKAMVMRNGGERVSVDEELPEGSFALQIVDQAMFPEYRSGDVVIAAPGIQPRKHDAVIVLLGGETGVLREYHPRGRDSQGSVAFDLIARNPDYPTLTVNSANAGKVLGVVVEHRRKRPF